MFTVNVIEKTKNKEETRPGTVKLKTRALRVTHTEDYNNDPKPVKPISVYFSLQLFLLYIFTGCCPIYVAFVA